MVFPTNQTETNKVMPRTQKSVGKIQYIPRNVVFFQKIDELILQDSNWHVKIELHRIKFIS